MVSGCGSFLLVGCVTGRASVYLLTGEGAGSGGGGYANREGVISCGNLFLRDSITIRANERSLAGGGAGRTDRAYLGVVVLGRVGSELSCLTTLVTRIGHNTVHSAGGLFSYYTLVPLVLTLAAGDESCGKSDKHKNQGYKTDFFHFFRLSILFERAGRQAMPPCSYLFWDIAQALGCGSNGYRS